MITFASSSSSYSSLSSSSHSFLVSFFYLFPFSSLQSAVRLRKVFSSCCVTIFYITANLATKFKYTEISLLMGWYLYFQPLYTELVYSLEVLRFFRLRSPWCELLPQINSVIFMFIMLFMQSILYQMATHVRCQYQPRWYTHHKVL